MLESISRFDRQLAMDSIFAEAHACKAESHGLIDRKVIPLSHTLHEDPLKRLHTI
jgi:hypothetical protein